MQTESQLSFEGYTETVPLSLNNFNKDHGNNITAIGWSNTAGEIRALNIKTVSFENCKKYFVDLKPDFLCSESSDLSPINVSNFKKYFTFTHQLEK